MFSNFRDNLGIMIRLKLYKERQEKILEYKQQIIDTSRKFEDVKNHGVELANRLYYLERCIRLEDTYGKSRYSKTRLWKTNRETIEEIQKIIDEIKTNSNPIISYGIKYVADRDQKNKEEFAKQREIEEKLRSSRGLGTL